MICSPSADWRSFLSLSALSSAGQTSLLWLYVTEVTSDRHVHNFVRATYFACGMSILQLYEMYFLSFFFKPLAASVLSLFTQHIDIPIDLDNLTSLLKTLLVDSNEVLNLSTLGSN